ncbi:ABC transporter I member 11, chloroplastic [Castilleja foliolosa]|uniref:ABC transporter I member 11, chloroplastic n=1 Tax=Castilleja foliolosa TaxID=1961234 RepID=A0ABD3CNC9_9LAMI
MATSQISLSTLFGSKPPVNRSPTSFSSPSRFSTDSKTSRARRISCDYSCFEVKDVSYRPSGTEIDLLNGISFSLPDKSFGLIFGRSGSGKTTLLQLLAGLSKPTSGSIHIQRYGDDGQPNQSPEELKPGKVGIVFQFPENNVLDELIFGWPRQRVGLQLREFLTSRLQKAMTSVGLTEISLDKDPQSLSGGYKRRLALAIQLVQTPDLLILDEPLAGLDWKARADVVKLLKELKKELTLLVVSHDLKAGISRRSVLEDGNGWRIEKPMLAFLITWFLLPDKLTILQLSEPIFTHRSITETYIINSCAHGLLEIFIYFTTV